MADTNIKPNEIGQSELSTFVNSATKFSNNASSLFGYQGTVTPDFLDVLTKAKYFAQSLNQVLPQLIAELNKYPTS